MKKIFPLMMIFVGLIFILMAVSLVYRYYQISDIENMTDDYRTGFISVPIALIVFSVVMIFFGVRKILRLRKV